MKAYEILSNTEKREEYDARILHGEEDLFLGLADAENATQPKSVMRVDGSDTWCTIDEHIRRKGAELSKTKLQGLSLRGISLAKAKLDGTDLDHASLLGADFTNAKLENIDFSSCELLDARFHATTRENILAPVGYLFPSSTPKAEVYSSSESPVLSPLKQIIFSLILVMISIGVILLLPLLAGC